jgi:hypothetical protein
MRPLRCLVAFSLAVMAFAEPRVAQAADCGPTGHGPVVYVTGTAKNYLAALARALYTAPEPITIIWRGNSSCEAMDATLSNTPLTEQGVIWDPSSLNANNEVMCDMPLPDAGVITADISISDVFPETCIPLPNGLPSDVGDFRGPVQTMAFVVPKASTQKSISATAAYFVYGFGGDSGVAPWIDGNQIFRLDNASGTQRILAVGIGVPVDKWKGVNLDHSAVLISTIGSTSGALADSTIGIIAATNIVGTVVQQMNVLAFKHFGQSCAYYPDSSESSHDKRNVRDGHYAAWAPVHIFTKIDTKGYPVNPDALRVINYLTGTTPPPGGLDLVDVAALNNLVPACAMKVQRQKEMGPMSAFKPTSPCHCYFEYKANGTTSCTPCTMPSECPASAPNCSFGYCESP